MTEQALVTTSWDDAHKLDLSLSALFKKYGLKATRPGSAMLRMRNWYDS